MKHKVFFNLRALFFSLFFFFSMLLCSLQMVWSSEESADKIRVRKEGLLFPLKKYEKEQEEEKKGHAFIPYNALTQRFATYCTTSMYRTKKSKKKGGKFSHAVMYLHGVCRDESKEYPAIKICPEGTDLSDPRNGVALSMNWDFSSSAFNVVEGQDFLFYGLIGKKTLEFPKRPKMTAKSWEEAIEHAMQREYFDKIRFYDRSKGYSGGAKESDDEKIRERVISRSIGSDFATTFTKTTYCANIPLNKKMTEDLVGYYNQINSQYNRGPEETRPVKKFKWHPIQYNCSHLHQNALASLGFFRKKKINKGTFKQLFDLCLPSSLYLDVVNTTNELDLRVGKLFSNLQDREFFEKYGRPRCHPGGVTPVHAFIEDNFKFLGKPDVPVLGLKSTFSEKTTKKKKIKTLVKKAQYQTVRGNLEHFKKKYKAALDDLEKSKDSLEYLKKNLSKNYRRSEYIKAKFKLFYEQYREFLKTQLATIENLLEQET